MLVYIAVANFNILLSEHAAAEGSFVGIAHKLLRSKDLPDYDTRISYSSGEHKFHLLVSNGIRYLCLADAADGVRNPFLTLEKVQSQFLDKFGVLGKTAADNTPFRQGFDNVLADIQRDYADTGPDKAAAVRDELDRVRDVALQNIDKVMERGEHIDTLVERTNLLGDSAMSFKRASTRLRTEMQWQAMKMKIVIGVGVLGMITVIGVSVCGWGFSSCM